MARPVQVVYGGIGLAGIVLTLALLTPGAVEWEAGPLVFDLYYFLGVGFGFMLVLAVLDAAGVSIIDHGR